MSGSTSLLVRRRPGRHRGRQPYLVLTALLALVAGFLLVVTSQSPARAAGTLLSQGKPATASSTENAGTPASAAFDGDPGTRWSSAASDPQWIQVDLGSTQSISQVTLNWETAYAKAFTLQTSTNGTSWTTIYSTTTATGGVQNLTVNGSGRYVRLNGTVRATQWGYSLWEFQVYGAGGTNPGACNTTNAALNHTATASSTENAGTPASAAVDGNTGTRWSSAFSDPQWLQVDLGASQQVCGIGLNWEAAYATAYQIQVTDNPSGTWTTVYSTTSATGGVQNLNVTGTGRYVRINTTARATAYGVSLWEFQVFTTTGGTTNGGGNNGGTTGGSTGGTTPPDSFWGTTDDIPAAHNVMELKILNRTNGAYPDSQVYWSFNGQVHSIADQPYFDMPANSSGRMYFYVGSPNSQYYDFIEFTIGATVFNGNTTRVDAWGLPLAIRLHSHDGQDIQLGDSQDLFTMSRDQVFANFQASVPQQFKVLAQTQAPYRIIAPGSDPSFREGGVNANYFTAYAQSVGVNEPTSNIFGCAGSMGADAAKCAALNRHTATLPAAQQQDPTKFYSGDPANWYAKYWHDHGINHLAYGFPYDDVAGQAAYASQQNPQWMEIAVGY
ncbi:discoidin domain-containing protein [Actinacidiphila epipremni]|uniref:Coagulation factor 5/8 type domain-containing protein n=1 Tax=Actinacidiphila epipremni TaxID=2053013 RepID=A0ABX0ZFS6_9ACTN|nr:discoidin domain-containing protein [Actinacidiphila epipremni]NJP41957.1 coagulation factor 5/8 type domain-containing protein [Actinacidiphila epipremni]